jgi:hypothetical protein
MLQQQCCQVLKQWHPELPKDARTLLQPVNCGAVETVSGGEYYHFGITSALTVMEDYIIRSGKDTLKIYVSIDDLPLFKSSYVQLWPILGMLGDIKQPFTIGAFAGKSKPASLNHNNFM